MKRLGFVLGLAVRLPATPALAQLQSGTISGTATPDTFWLPNLWNTKARMARAFTPYNVRIRLIADLFNVFNANTALVRNHDIDAPTSNRLAQNLSPSVARSGLMIGF